MNRFETARFLSSLEKCTGGFAATTDRLGLAVSGGPDSLALLLLAHDAFPDRIAVATVNHLLRPEAAEEAGFVARLCLERAIPHQVLTPAVPIAGNIQSQARAVRYALLEQWRIHRQLSWIATAHHGDDQRETLLMRLARGSGVAGLAGVRAVNGTVVRPLLDYSKAELLAICADAGIVPCHDPSNDSDDYDRVRIRKYLEAADFPVGVTAAGRSAAALASAEEALQWMVAQLAAERIAFVQEHMLATLDPAALPHELVRRLLVRGLRLIDPACSPRGTELDRLIAALQRRERRTIGAVLCKGGALWQLCLAPPRRAI